MNAIQITKYQCPHCQSVYDTPDDVEKCVNAFERSQQLYDEMGQHVGKVISFFEDTPREQNTLIHFVELEETNQWTRCKARFALHSGSSNDAFRISWFDSPYTVRTITEAVKLGWRPAYFLKLGKEEFIEAMGALSKEELLADALNRWVK